MLKNRRLGTILIVLILTATAIIFVAVLAYNDYASRKVIMNQVAENARNITRSTANEINMILHGVEKIPLNLAGMIEKYSNNREDLNRLIRNALTTNAEIFGVAIAFEPYSFDPDSLYFSPYGYWEEDQIKLTSLGGDTYHYFNWDWYKIPKELNRSIWTEPYYDEGGGNIIMSTFSVPFYREVNGKRQLRGIVTSDISLMWLKDILPEVKIYQNGYAFLISENGVFLTHPEETFIMQESIFSIAEKENNQQLSQIGREMISGGEGFVPLRDSVSGEDSWIYFAPLPSTRWALGMIISEEELFAPVRELSARIVLIGISGLLFLAVIITLISRMITKPLRMLEKSTSTMALGDFTVSVEETGPKEIAHLGRSFNELGQKLTEYIEKRDFIRDTFGRYLTQEVVNRLLESHDGLALGGERRSVTIMMSDLRGFTSLSERLEPEQVVQMLNDYFEVMVDVILKYNGTINEIIGDALLIIFGAPQEMPDRAQQAIACAIEMQNRMAEVNERNRVLGLPLLEMGIGVNETEVIVGNIGSTKRSKYAAVGSGVNMTSRIESYSVGGQILISESIRREAGGVLRIDAQREVAPKGAERPITIYEVGGISGRFNLVLEGKEPALGTLVRRIPLQYSVLEGKDVGEKRLEGSMTRIAKTCAEIMLDGPVEVLTNLKMNLTHVDEKLTATHFYGKVVQNPGEKEPTHIVRFTSVPPEMDSYFQALIKYAVR